MNFASDNTAGIAPEILQALAAGNDGFAMGYGNDDVTRAVERRIGEIFERDAAVFLVPTGTAANALALAHISPPWGAVFAHAEAHILTDECGAPEFFGGGLKLVGMPGIGCKVTPDTLAETVTQYEGHTPHQVVPAAFSFAQASEAGTIYRPDEIAALAKLAHAPRHEGPHGRRALCQRDGADEREPGRGHLEGGRRCAVVRRHQGRRHGGGGGGVLRPRACRQHGRTPQARRPSRVQASLPRAAVRRRFSRTTAGCGLRATPTRWPIGSPQD